MNRIWVFLLFGVALVLFQLQASSGANRHIAKETDVLHLRYSEQTECFMVLLKWPISGPPNMPTRSGNPLKTVDATDPSGAIG